MGVAVTVDQDANEVGEDAAVLKVRELTSPSAAASILLALSDAGTGDNDDNADDDNGTGCNV